MAEREPRDAVLKPHIDEKLPELRDMTIEEWCTKFDVLGRIPGRIERDIFALTGHFSEPMAGAPDGKRNYRMRLDTTQCAVRDDITLSSMCDIDSVLGVVTTQFPIADTATMKYFMLHDERYTLKANLHLPTVTVTDTEGVSEDVKIHKLPNTRFATIGDFTVYLILPELRHEADRNARGTNANYVGEYYLQLLYDLAVKPAAVSVLPDDRRRTWPADYSSEMFRAAPAAGEGNRLQATGREVHGGEVNRWIDAIKDNVKRNAELSFAHGFFFLVEGKGLKNTAGVQHEPPLGPLVDPDGHILDDNNPRTVAVRKVLADFKPEHFEAGAWFLDIATTFSAVKGPDRQPVSLFVNYAAHCDILNHFTGIATGLCERWVEADSGGYSKDEEAQLGDFAGFRCEPEEPEDGVHYVQAYSSSKSVTYHLSSGGSKKAKSTSTQKILDDWPGQRRDHFIPLQEAFRKASETHSVAARFETRLGYEWYLESHLATNDRIIRHWFYFLRNTQYWGFKWRRLMAINNVLNRILTSPARKSLTTSGLPEVGTLVILLAWMSNALINRPADGGTWDEIRDVGCVHGEFDGMVLPIRPQTIYFIHSLRLSLDKHLLPRISSHRTALMCTIVYLSCDSRDGRTEVAALRKFRGIEATVVAPPLPTDPWGVRGDDDPTMAGASRQSNRQRKVTVLPAKDTNDAFAGVVRTARAMVRYASEGLDPEQRDAGLPLSQQMTNIVFAFPVQVFAKVPTARGGTSWCKLNEDQLHKITLDIFGECTAPSHLFTSYVDCGNDKIKWDTTVHAWFPSAEVKARMKKIQGLSQLSAWADWEMLLLDCDAKTSAKVISAARDLVNKRCRWLPWMTKGKLWPTGAHNRSKGTGPWIIFNPRFIR